MSPHSFNYSFVVVFFQFARARCMLTLIARAWKYTRFSVVLYHDSCTNFVSRMCVCARSGFMPACCSSALVHANGVSILPHTSRCACTERAGALAFTSVPRGMLVWKAKGVMTRVNRFLNLRHTSPNRPDYKSSPLLCLRDQ